MYEAYDCARGITTVSTSDTRHTPASIWIWQRFSSVWSSRRQAYSTNSFSFLLRFYSKIFYLCIASTLYSHPRHISARCSSVLLRFPIHTMPRKATSETWTPKTLQPQLCAPYDSLYDYTCMCWCTVPSHTIIYAVYVCWAGSKKRAASRRDREVKNCCCIYIVYRLLFICIHGRLLLCVCT